MGAAASSADTSRLPALTVAILCAVWTAVVTAVAFDRYETFRAHRFDLGNMVQVVWSSAHGRLLEMTLSSGTNGSRLAAHVDPVLVLFVPAWWVWPDPRSMILVQACVIASGAVPMFLLGRALLTRSSAAVLVAASYLVYPWVSWNAIEDVHPTSLALPLVAWAIWFAHRDRPVAFTAVVVVVAACGELLGLTVAALAVWYALARGRRRLGAAVAAAGIAWTVVCLRFVVPAFAEDGNPFYGRYESVGGSPAGLVRTIFTDPGAVLNALTGSEDLRYLWWLGMPVLWLLLWAPGFVLVAAPQLLVNMLSDWEPATLPNYHYSAVVVPIVLVTTLRGVARAGRSRPLMHMAAVVAACAASLVVVGPWPGREPGLWPVADAKERTAAMERAVARVPSDASVAFTNRLGSQLSARRHALLLPVTEGADWIVLDVTDGTGERVGREPHGDVVRRIDADPTWARVSDEGGIRVYRRVAGPGRAGRTVKETVRLEAKHGRWGTTSPS